MLSTGMWMAFNAIVFWVGAAFWTKKSWLNTVIKLWLLGMALINTFVALRMLGWIVRTVR